MTTPQTTASARKIANYTQSISSGVTNLLTELGRVNGPGSGTDEILTQLQTLTSLIQDMNTRLFGVEKTLQRLETADRSAMIENKPEEYARIEGVYTDTPNLTAEEHNSRARRYNQFVWCGNNSLMPLRTTRNTVVVGFPSTLGHLLFLDHAVEQQLLNTFGLSSNRDDLWKFIGVSTERRMIDNYTPGESLATFRMEQHAQREREIEAAGPITVQTKRAAAVHNRIARKANGASARDLMPIHDDHNIPVCGWPSTLNRLANPYRQWDVLFLLKEYEQKTDKAGCLDRLIKFVGVNKSQVIHDCGQEECDHDEGPGESRPYWLM